MLILQEETKNNLKEKYFSPKSSIILIWRNIQKKPAKVQKLLRRNSRLQENDYKNSEGKRWMYMQVKYFHYIYRDVSYLWLISLYLFNPQGAATLHPFIILFIIYYSVITRL